MQKNILKNHVLQKIANAARNKGGFVIKEIEHFKIAAFDLSIWKGKITYPAGMDNFQEETRVILGKEIMFLFPRNVLLEKTV